MERGVGTVACGATNYPIITSKNDDKSEKDFVEMKLHRDPTSENLDVYEFKMTLFYNGDREDFCSLIISK